MKAGGPSRILREEFLHAACLCAPGFEHLPGLTFAANPSGDWEAWGSGLWDRHLVPAFLEARIAAVTGARELQAIDRRLDANLVGPAAGANREAARHLASHGVAPSGERILARYLREAGPQPLHFSTLFAARSAVFHVPPHIALGALLLIEFRPLPLGELWTAVERCLPAPGECGAGLRAA